MRWGVQVVQSVQIPDAPATPVDPGRLVGHGAGVDDFDPHLYRLLHCGSEGDVAFYRRLCRGAADVLELGCGDGRVLVPIAAAGSRVVGLDAHPGMLAEAARRRDACPPALAARVELVQGDLAGFALGRRFDRVILPYCGLYCVNHDAQVACLRAAAAHLRPGGRVAFDAYLLPAVPEEGETAAPEWLTTLTDGERTIEVFEQDRHWPDERRCTVTYVHQIHQGDTQRVVQYTLAHHYLWPHDVPPLLTAAGLVIESAWQDFEGTPFGPDAEHLVVVAKAAPVSRGRRFAPGRRRSP